MDRKEKNNSNFGNKWTDEQKKRQSILTKKAMDKPEIRKQMRDNHADVSKENNPNSKVHIGKKILLKYYIKQRKSPRKIARIIGCDKSVIYKRLQWYKIEIRTPKEASKDKHSGANNGNYKGGITPLANMIRHLLEYINWRNQIFKRDNYTCQECEQIGGNLEAHHIKPFAELLQEFLKEYDQFSPIEDKETLVRLAMKWKLFWEVNNGKTLCEDCHNITKREAFNYGRTV